MSTEEELIGEILHRYNSYQNDEQNINIDEDRQFILNMFNTLDENIRIVITTNILVYLYFLYCSFQSKNKDKGLRNEIVEIIKNKKEKSKRYFDENKILLSRFGLINEEKLV